MAKIRNAKPKNTSGGYFRLLGHRKLADLLTKSQSTVITNGTELEKLVTSKANCIKDLNDFIYKVNTGLITKGTYLCPKGVVRASAYRLEKKEPDFLIFTLTSTGKNCYIIELKDGDQFDTKKSSGEKEALQIFKNHIGSMIEFKTNYRICAFNQLDKNKIALGFKNAFTIEEIMTGKEFCDLLGISYEEIINKRKLDSMDNLDYFIEEILNIVEIRDKYSELQKEVVEEADFYKNDE